MRRFLRELAGGWARDERGSFGIMFGIAVTPMLVMAGAAVDYAGASRLSTALQSATDSTVLTLCEASPSTSVADLKSRAQTNIQALVGEKGTVSVNDPQVTNNPRTVSLTASTSYSTAFMRVMNQVTVPISATAGCSASEMYFEIALVLDTTGSMSKSGGGQSKMEAAKTAATNFVDYMFTTGALPGHVRMSLVPFAASVNLPTAWRSASWLDTSGLSPLHWQYVSNPSAQGFTSRLSIFNKLKVANSNWGWEGCVESPAYPHNVTDEAPSVGTPKSLIMPLFAPDEVGNTTTCTVWGYTFSCQDASNYNSYMDDGPLTTGACLSNATSLTTRFTQACKYNLAIKDMRTSVPGPNAACTSRAFSTLGTSQATLKTELAALQPEGNTNIHEGFMWGWRTLSPVGVFAGQASPPVAYNTPEYTKVIVLMTDGVNTWGANDATIGKSNYSAYGYFRNADGTDATASNSRFRPTRTNLQTDEDARLAMDELLLDACSNAKAKGVRIYTVGFSTTDDPIDSQGLQLLKTCASGADYAFVANDSSGLISAFDKIAKGIGSLRITK